jgi:hypothetical protein
MAITMKITVYSTFSTTHKFSWEPGNTFQTKCKTTMTLANEIYTFLDNKRKMNSEMHGTTQFRIYYMSFSKRLNTKYLKLYSISAIILKTNKCIYINPQTNYTLDISTDLFMSNSSFFVFVAASWRRR